MATLPAIILFTLSRAPGADGGARCRCLAVSLTSFTLLAVGLEPVDSGHRRSDLLGDGDAEWAWQDTPPHRHSRQLPLFPRIAGWVSPCSYACDAGAS